ncbi:MAG: glycosyltransferase [Candidatus Omnitrophica bacterium]|nr:glycosyltransferase [Candidatus Omnitrophota bacterium]
MIELSVVIPTYNRKEALRNCLLSLKGQDFQRDKYEIIVVDDSSQDGTEELVRSLAGEDGNIRYVKQLHKGPAAARNLGAKEANGPVVGFTDDDCVLEKDWIRLMVQSHRDDPLAIAVGGLTKVPYQKANIMISQALSNGAIQDRLNGESKVIFFPTCNVSFKRGVLSKYRFDEDFPLPGGEDLEFFWRLFKQGYRFVWNKDILVTHFRPDSFGHFISQAYIYGRGNLLTKFLHQDQPLLKELKTGTFSFWAATLINILKIPRFSFILGKKLIKESQVKSKTKRSAIYVYFVLHKMFYIFGNICEYFRIRRNGLRKRNDVLGTPKSLILDITHRCNLSCRICDIWKTQDSEKDIGISYIRKMLAQAKALQIEEIALSGGEPLLREDIFEIFDYANSLKITNLGVLTNGILVNSLFDRLRPYIIDNTISLVISFDSLKEDLHNHLRASKEAWQKTKGALEMLSRLKREHPQAKANVITIVLNQNLEELLDLAGFLKSLNIDTLQFQVLLPNNLRMAQRKESQFWVPEERLNLLDKAIDGLIELKTAEPHFIKNSVSNLALMKKYYRACLSCNDVLCSSANKTVLVSNQGDCRTCFSAYGDIKTTDLDDILRSKQRLKAQEEAKRCHWPCLLPCFCDQ